MNGAGRKPTMLLMKTMRPLLCARIVGSTAWVMRTGPKKFTSNNRCACSSEVSSIAPTIPDVVDEKVDAPRLGEHFPHTSVDRRGVPHVDQRCSSVAIAALT